MAIGEGLAIVIVLLLAEAQCHENDVVGSQECRVMYVASSIGGEVEVAHNDRQCCRVIAPVGVIGCGEGVMVV